MTTKGKQRQQKKGKGNKKRQPSRLKLLPQTTQRTEHNNNKLGIVRAILIYRSCGSQNTL